MNESLKELAVRYFEGPIAPEEECELFGFLAASPENAALMREWEREWKQRHVPSADVLRSLARLNGKIERRENRIELLEAACLQRVGATSDHDHLAFLCGFEMVRDKVEQCEAFNDEEGGAE